MVKGLAGGRTKTIRRFDKDRPEAKQKQAEGVTRAGRRQVQCRQKAGKGQARSRTRARRIREKG